MKQSSSILIVFILAALDQVLAVEPPIVKIKTGQVRGYEKTTAYEDRKVHIYEGIRYAKPPVGELRFQKPQPAEPWTGIYNATHYRHACMRLPELYPDDQIPQSKNFSEDCLFLTVYKPGKKSDKKLPVMVWIHGGGFESGSAFSPAYDGSLIATIGDVIVVTLNYRLGAFGFLYAGIESAPGNMGLYDQHLALKWVQENIEQFGGDPSMVTLAGESAGSMSVGAHILSPLSKGLFKRAIMHSGAPNSMIGSQSKEKTMDRTIDLANKYNCDTKDKEKMVACIRKLSPDKIVEATKGGRYKAEIFEPTWGEAFLPIEPIKALKNGQYNQNLDLLFGNMQNEGTIFTEVIFPNYLSPFLKKPDVNKKKIQSLIELLFMISQIPGATEGAKYYLKGIDDNDIDGLRAAVGAAFGDSQIACPNVFFAEEYVKTSTSNNVFAFKLTHRPVISSFKECVGYMGVCHGTDVLVFFGIPIQLRGTVFPEPEYQMSLDMIKAWTNFMYHGKPNKLGQVEWKPALNKSESNGHFSYMNLGLPDSYKMVPNGFVKYCDNFWKNLIFK